MFVRSFIYLQTVINADYMITRGRVAHADPGHHESKRVTKEEITAYVAEVVREVNFAIHEYLNDSSSPRHLDRLLGKSGYEFDVAALQKAITEPANYLLNLGGNRWRPVFMLTIIEALGGKKEDFLEFAIVPEIIHNATLVHDDIEDNSDMRRGAPSVHKKFGVPLALNLGDFMYYFPTVAVLDSEKLPTQVKLRFLEVYQRNMLRACVGQAMDIAWGEGVVDISSITESYYFQMVYGKTGALLEMAGELGATVVGASKELTDALGRCCATLGVAFQIGDDLLDLKPSGITKKKGGIGEDITDGKATLMVVYTLSHANQKDKERLHEILRQHTGDEAAINEAIAIMDKYGAREYCADTAKKIVHTAWNDVDKLLPPSLGKERLRALIEMVLNRTG